VYLYTYKCQYAYWTNWLIRNFVYIELIFVSRKYNFILNLSFAANAMHNCDAKQFVRDMSRRLGQIGDDPRSESFLVQRLSIIQRGNAAGIMGTFAPGTARGD
jgi:hypothetical protein